MLVKTFHRRPIIDWELGPDELELLNNNNISATETNAEEPESMQVDTTSNDDEQQKTVYSCLQLFRELESCSDVFLAIEKLSQLLNYLDPDRTAVENAKVYNYLMVTMIIL